MKLVKVEYSDEFRKLHDFTVIQPLKPEKGQKYSMPTSQSKI